MKDLGRLNYFLGLEVYYGKSGISLSQVKYASDLISRTLLTDEAVKNTPIGPNAHFVPTDGTVLENPTRYQQLIGGLIYLTMTCPDITYAIHIISQFTSEPQTTHYAAVLWILQYVKGTLYHGLYFFARSSLILQAYTDANWGGDHADH
ncbi:uncharacterized protein LOC114726913 [Neltuma alba]|uniref:uncharacterized protein LOC114726913 n=1 Tax=Neltuma alba TaxID=207710 RepID=UPI0010A35F27|nr:uncharacterized protein LOC114726913 [Prosopis alba]